LDHGALFKLGPDGHRTQNGRVSTAPARDRSLVCRQPLIVELTGDRETVIFTSADDASVHSKLHCGWNSMRGVLYSEDIEFQMK
jgi:hypothetical protein